MKMCSQCDELNGAPRATCFQCNAPLEPAAHALPNHQGSYAEEEDAATGFDYFISFVIPLAGWIRSSSYKKKGLYKRAKTCSTVAWLSTAIGGLVTSFGG